MSSTNPPAPDRGGISHPTFTVDTHLFRELGELLVGRDSTALVELVKNAYDADATEVIVYGEALDDMERGYVAIQDNGLGMGRAAFEDGFLRIASRKKEQGDRRSLLYARRYTGAKGIGRLAAHKLARIVEVVSLKWDGSRNGRKSLKADSGVEAAIRWDLVEAAATLDALGGTDAISVKEIVPPGDARPGTRIVLRHLRRPWAAAAQSRFLEEIQTFGVPAALGEPLASSAVARQLLFGRPTIRDAKTKEGDRFVVKLEGALAPAEGFWQAHVDAANWVLEIEASNDTKIVKYSLAPTRLTLEELPNARPASYSIPHPAPAEGPFFQSRILLRTGRAWGGPASGVRVFVEGFRILPYGESRNDWLSLDRDATERGKGRFVPEDQQDPIRELLQDDKKERDVGLLVLPNKHYFGAVFLTQEGGAHLRTLVNREGFVPDGVYETLVTLVRGGIDLLTRSRAAASERERAERRAQRARKKGPADAAASARLRSVVSRARVAAAEARHLLGDGKVKEAAARLNDILEAVEEIEAASDNMISEAAMLRVLASVGTQMAAFVHEINGLVGTAEAVDHALRRLRTGRTRGARNPEQAQVLNNLTRVVADLRRNLERQASYLVDVVTPDARRRRARQKVAERFDAASRLVATAADARGIRIENGIPGGMLSPPMFQAELTTVFSNLLTNAIKAAGNNGRIRATAGRRAGGIYIKIENTGVGVDPEKGERWFRPFESSTVQVDAVLGQGMGLGLPITRSVLGEYGATIQFVAPSPKFATGIEIYLPVKGSDRV